MTSLIFEPSRTPSFSSLALLRGSFDPFGQSCFEAWVLGFEILDHLDEFFWVARAKSSRRGCTNLFMGVQCVSRW